MNLTQPLHRALQQAPHLPLTVTGDQELDVTTVVDRVARLAAAIRCLGARDGDRVGILGPNSGRFAELLWACWWAGVVAHPLNVRWSTAEIDYALRDSGTRLLFVDDPTGERRSGFSGLDHLVDFGEARPMAPEALWTEDLVAAHGPVEDHCGRDDDLALLLYTGGTTGFPKGVMISHRGAMTPPTSALSVGRAYSVRGNTLIAFPMFHISAMASIIAQSALGGSLVFTQRFDAAEVLRLIEHHRITTLPLAPTMIEMLLEAPELEATDVSSVRSVVYGASPMPEATLRAAMARFPNARFNQSYGMTETGMITLLAHEDHIAGSPQLASAGRATPHAEVRVVDPEGAERPRGQVGEIVTRGDNLMLGYWNKPAETAAALRDGWLRTGDLGRMDEHGFVYVVDRLKDMIISGGENIYASEVEKALLSHPDVARCAVFGVADDRWGERVHGVVVRRPGATTDLEELQAHVRTLIARYKVPRSLEFCDEIPTTPSGKISKQLLKDRHNASDQPALVPEARA